MIFGSKYVCPSSSEKRTITCFASSRQLIFQLSLGGLDLELYSVPGGETLDALLIYLPQHKILFSGNAFGPLFPHIPNFCTIRGDRIRFAIPYLDMCKKVLELNPVLKFLEVD